MNFRPYHTNDPQSDTSPLPQLGDRLNDKTAPPDESAIRKWLGPQAFKHWIALCSWIDASYPAVFDPEWLYGGKKRGWVLRYKKTKAFCTLLPAYQLLSVQVVLGKAERENFEKRRHTWSDNLVKLYDEARPYPDGKWLAVAISSKNDRHEVIELMGMKRPPPVPGKKS